MIMKNGIIVFAVAVILALAGSLYAGDSMGRTLDMTYPYDENTIYWPNATTFKQTREYWGINDKGYWYAANNYGADKVALENIAGLDKLPKTGATLYVVPMLIRNGTGAPARVFTVLP
ncbi:MAG: hypothetical protein WCW53_07275 [Syntrophales bacterium]|jgi:kynurenine formamidase